MAHSLREMEGFLKVRDDRATLHFAQGAGKETYLEALFPCELACGARVLQSN